MKSLLILALMLFSFQSFAIESGYYECATQEEDMNDSYEYSFQFMGDSLSMYADEYPEMEFVTADQSEDYVDVSLDDENEELGMYFFKYKFYIDDSNHHLTFVSLAKYIDSEATVKTTSVFSSLGDGQVQISEKYEYDDGYEEDVISLCHKEE